MEQGVTMEITEFVGLTKIADQRCVICEEQIGIDSDGIWDGGHNAEPIQSGRCCEQCNDTRVTPARMAQWARGVLNA